MSHGIVSTEEVLTGVQAGRPSAVGMGPSVAKVGRAFEVSPERAAPLAARASGTGEEGRVAQLERKVGPQALEIDFLKECLQRMDEQRKLQASRPRGTEPKP